MTVCPANARGSTRAHGLSESIDTDPFFFLFSLAVLPDGIAVNTKADPTRGTSKADSGGSQAVRSWRSARDLSEYKKKI